MHVRKMALVVLSVVLVATPAAALGPQSPAEADGHGSWTAWLGDAVSYVRDLILRDVPGVDVPTDSGTVDRPGTNDTPTLRTVARDDRGIGGGYDPDG